MLTPLDDSFTHQRVAPHALAEHVDPRWAERCYHLLVVDPEVVLCAGRQLYPYAGRRAAFLAVTDGRCQVSVRAAEPFALGDDPNLGRVGPLLLEPLVPLRTWRIVLDDPAVPVAVDLTFESRLAPLATPPNRIERDGAVLTHYMNVFQSGLYRGVVSVDGVEHRLEGRLGFRDRGWGLRRHEGSPARGLVVFVACELPDRVLHLLLYETASGGRAYTGGAVTRSDGAVAVTGAEHDLVFRDGLLESGSLEVSLADGSRSHLDLEVTGRLYLSLVGYSREPQEPGIERTDVSDPAVVAAVSGQNDNACRFRLDGVEGHGFVETGLGVHARYRPERLA